MELVNRAQYTTQNLHPAERIASVIAGGVLGFYGIRQGIVKHSIPGAGLALAGAALVRRGLTGYCDVYHSLGIQTKPREGAEHPVGYKEGIRVDRSVTINANRDEVFAFWRNIQNLPRFMTHVCSVKRVDDRVSHWVAEGPAGMKIEWDAEIINEIPGELIAWQSLPGADVNSAGSVRFEHATAGRGTRLSVSLQYEPPAGRAGAMVAKLFGKDVDREVDEDLRRMKNILEAGEIPTSEGQSSAHPSARMEQAKKDSSKQTNVQDASEQSFPASDAPAYSH